MELFLKMQWRNTPQEWLREFQAELICTVGFGGLKPIRRVFV